MLVLLIVIAVLGDETVQRAATHRNAERMLMLLQLMMVVVLLLRHSSIVMETQRRRWPVGMSAAVYAVVVRCCLRVGGHRLGFGCGRLLMIRSGRTGRNGLPVLEERSGRRGVVEQLDGGGPRGTVAVRVRRQLFGVRQAPKDAGVVARQNVVDGERRGGEHFGGSHVIHEWGVFVVAVCIFFVAADLCLCH